MKVVGLDLSLTSTGIAVVCDHHGLRGAVTDRIESKPARKIGKTDPPLTLEERAGRLRMLRERVREYVTDADLVLVEAPAYDSKSPHTHERSGLWWLVVDWCIRDGRPLVEVTTGGVKRYATGSGSASKDAVLAAVVRRYLDVEVSGNDEADALVLAAMGARWLGYPLEASLPKTHTAALDAVQWPEREAISA